MADIVLLGSPYVYGKAVEPRKPMFSYRIDTPITIGDTCPGKELRWVEASGLLVAQSDVLHQLGNAQAKDHDCRL